VTYYVDTASTAGGTGTTTATTGADRAWATIAEVNAFAFDAGDSILFKRGCTFREQLTVPSSGSAGLPITFGAYGTAQITSPYTSKAHTYKGQLHTHTTESDGVDDPDDLVTAYKTAGYDFVSITDHDGLTADPSIAGILFINGVEEDASDGNHIVSIGPTAAVAGGTAQQILTAINADAAFPMMAHPAWGSGGWSYAELEALVGYKGMGVFNAYIPLNSETRWDFALTRGRRVFGFAADDVHDISVNTIFGTTATMVYADALTLAEILANIKAGNFYSTYTAPGGTVIVPTLSLSGSVISVTTDNAATIAFIGNRGATLQTADNVTSASYTITGTEVYVRVRITLGTSKAWFNPIYVPVNHAIIDGSALVTTWTADGGTDGGPSVSLDLDDNFDDNDISNWEAVSGNVTVGSGYVTSTIETAASDRVRKIGLTSRTEAWLSFQVKLRSGHANIADGDYSQGCGLTFASSYKNIANIGYYRNTTTIVWSSRYGTDAGESSSVTSTAITEDVWHNIVIHWKASTGAGNNDGIVRVWVDKALLVNLSNVDSDTLATDAVSIGNISPSAQTSVWDFDNVKRGATGDAPVVGGTNVWTSPLTTNPAKLTYNGTAGTKQASIIACDAAGDFYWASNLLYLYAASDPDTLYITPGVEVTYRPYAVTTNSTDYTVINNIIGKLANTANVLINGANQSELNYAISLDGVAGVELGHASAKIQNSVIYGNTVGVDVNAAGAITNTIINGNTTGLDEAGGTAVVTYSALQAAHAGTGNITTDPLFVSVTDFHLQAASPARDAGVDVGLTTDYLGSTVPKNGSVDLGAYEYPSGIAVLTGS